MKKLFLIAILVGIVGTLAYLIAPPGIQLPDGSTLRVTSVQYGHTNLFLRGNLIERLSDGVIPTNGITIFSGIGSNRLFRLRLQKPGRMEISHHVGPQLGIMFQLRNVRTNSHIFLRRDLSLRTRIILDSGPDTLAYYGYIDSFQQHGNAYYFVGNVTAYPKTERNFRVRLDYMESRDWIFDGEWQTVAEFKLKNPAHTEMQEGLNWKTLTSTNVGHLHATLESIRVQSPATNLAHTRPALVSHITIGIKENGFLATNWLAHDFVIKDPEGNFLMQCFPINTTNQMREYLLWGALDPARPWSIRAQLAPNSGFNTNEIFTFRVPFPLRSPHFTNFAGEAVKIEFVNQHLLGVSLEGKPASRRITFIDAVNKNGQSVSDHGGSWGQHMFLKSLDGQYYEKGEIDATIAIHTNIPVEFIYTPDHNRPKAQ